MDAQRDEERRRFILDRRRDTASRSQALAKESLTLENAIKRSYFHKKPVTTAELDAWDNLLDFWTARAMNAIRGTLPEDVSSAIRSMFLLGAVRSVCT